MRCLCPRPEPLPKEINHGGRGRSTAESQSFFLRRGSCCGAGLFGGSVSGLFSRRRSNDELVRRRALLFELERALADPRVVRRATPDLREAMEWTLASGPRYLERMMEAILVEEDVMPCPPLQTHWTSLNTNWFFGDLERRLLPHVRELQDGEGGVGLRPGVRGRAAATEQAGGEVGGRFRGAGGRGEQPMPRVSPGVAPVPWRLCSHPNLTRGFLHPNLTRGFLHPFRHEGFLYPHRTRDFLRPFDSRVQTPTTRRIPDATIPAHHPPPWRPASRLRTTLEQVDVDDRLGTILQVFDSERFPSCSTLVVLFRTIPDCATLNDPTLNDPLMVDIANRHPIPL